MKNMNSGDELLKSLMKNKVIESPSIDFTNNVMEKIYLVTHPITVNEFSYIELLKKMVLPIIIFCGTMFFFCFDFTSFSFHLPIINIEKLDAIPSFFSALLKKISIFTRGILKYKILLP